MIRIVVPFAFILLLSPASQELAGNGIFSAPLRVPASSQGQATTPVVRILTDRNLWGKDLPVMLAYLQSWSRSGERRVLVFPDQMVGAAAFPSREGSQEPARRLAEALRASQPKPKPEFQVLLSGVPPSAPFQVSVISHFADDGSTRIAWTGTGLQFFNPRLTVAGVQERLGAPERVTREVVQTEKDERPVVLTLYQYAGGAIVFAESDLSQRPGFVDRVIFDVPAITAALF